MNGQAGKARLRLREMGLIMDDGEGRGNDYISYR